MLPCIMPAESLETFRYRSRGLGDSVWLEWVPKGRLFWHMVYGIWYKCQPASIWWEKSHITMHIISITYNSAKDTSMGDDVSMGQLNDDECNAAFDLYDQAVGNDASCVDDVCSKACLRMVLL